MTPSASSEQITIDPEVMDGLPVIRGTRIPVYMILEMLEAGLDIEDVCREYPQLSADQVKSAISFAESQVHGGVVG